MCNCPNCKGIEGLVVEGFDVTIRPSANKLPDGRIGFVVTATKWLAKEQIGERRGRWVTAVGMGELHQAIEEVWTETAEN